MKGVLYRASELIEAAHDDLLPMQSHLHFLTLFQQELQTRSRGETFIIFNDIVWKTLLDSRDVLVIHIASWAKGLYDSGGRLNHLSENCAPQFFASKRIDRSATDIMKLTLHRRREVYESLFPAAAKRGGRPAKDDVRQLVAQFKTKAAPLVEDRNDNRAHPYECRGSAKAAMLSLEKLEMFVRYAHDFLNNLQSLCGHFTTAYSERLTFADATRTASDLVDLVLFGSTNRMALLSGLSSVHYEETGRYPWQYRDDLYEMLWANRKLADQPFNAPEQFLDG